jgi:hypothetical protein
MKAVAQFLIYLTTEFRSANGAPFGKKVATDYASRVRRIDSMFGRPIDDEDLLNDELFKQIIIDIKSKMLGDKTPEEKVMYPYQTYIVALRRYRDFLQRIT